MPGEASTAGASAAERAAQSTLRALGGRHRPTRRGRPGAVLSAELASLETTLDQARALLARDRRAQPEHAATAEWLLDNFYVVRRALRLVREHLPPRFQRRLPCLAAGPDAGKVRLRQLAGAVLAGASLQVDTAYLDECIRDYQAGTALTIAELWALPAMLRFCTLEHLADSVASLGAGAAPAARRRAAVTLARAIRCLHFLSETEWKEFFERHSAVEAALGEDPARAYGRMGFDSRDRYRKVVEEVAWGAGLAEVDVARKTVALARSQDGNDERMRHVGYWLVDAGRPILEAQVGYRPPCGVRLRRFLTSHPASVLIGAIAFVTMLGVGAAGFYLAAVAAPVGVWVAAMLVTAIPASTVAVTVVQWVVTRLLPPRVLPKLDLDDGIPADLATAVVIPALLGDADEVRALIRQVEIHWLANPDPALRFALLTDHPDAPAERMPGQEELVQLAAEGVRLLNAKYGAGRFHLLHRAPRFNPAEGCWMGWERKRGKLEEFARWLRGATDTGFVVHVGEPGALAGIRFVITLDSDTQLPRGAAKRLIGTLAHPLNRAVFDPATGRVRAGYTVLQPRIEISPETAGRSVFAQMFAGETGLDIYTRAVSDVYQDLAGEGIYVGKGIYDVDAFRRSLDGRVPQNALASHDLFEGVHGRAALCTDIALFEEYPPYYLAYARRLHRWVRGDWQLLPWLGRKVPLADGSRAPTVLTALDRWKLLDNLRRSLLAPSLVVLLVSAWLWLPGSPLVWTLAALGVPATHLFTSVAGGLARGLGRRAAGRAFASIAADVRADTGRWLVAVVFLAYEAVLSADAIVRVLWRLGVSHAHLLQWTSTSHTTRRLARRGGHRLVWTEMVASPVLAAVVAAVVALLAPDRLGPAAPLLLVWVVAPEVARRISIVREPVPAPVGVDDERYLRRLARRIWLWFETFVGPGDHWLPPDHFQEQPRGEAAHRTSPTNIGMMLASTVAAWDLGYVTSTDLALRLRSSLDTVEHLERRHGHLLNWYDTATLAPLLPRYVSAVDSGNLAGCLLAVAQGCAEVATSPPLSPRLLDGFLDTVDLCERAVGGLAGRSTGVDLAELLRSITAMRAAAEEARPGPPHVWAAIRSCGDLCDDLDRRLMAALGGGTRGIDLLALRKLRVWIERVHHGLRSARREVELLLPWLAVPAAAGDLASEVELPSPGISLDDLPDACAAALAALERCRTPANAAANDMLSRALSRGAENARALRDELLSIAVRAEQIVAGMDFAFLYDADRRLMFIGYDVTADRMDEHHYDLLASESRLASFIAIAKGDLPLEHWYALGRSLARAGRSRALLSWGGSMFEYLMPSLLMRSTERTLLAESCRLAVERQIRYGRERSVPWGISESGFSEVDADRSYQYRSFGVPGLGFKRGLGDDLVVAPYASLLALPLRPRAVLANLRAIDELGGIGLYGPYEALDFTPKRVPSGQRCSIVRSWMSHHEGMSLVALDNYLLRGPMLRRFHANALVQTGGLLLHERVPTDVSTESASDASHEADAEAPVARPLPAPWSPLPNPAAPEACFLTNGRLTSVVTDAGGGFLALEGLALTRWQPDPTADSGGVWIFVKDEETGRVWSATPAPCFAPVDDDQVVFHAHQVEFHRRFDDLSVHVEVAVAPGDDVEVRRVSVTDESGRCRRVLVTTCAEPVLAGRLEDARHPAFSRLFLESEHVAALDALLFRRRAKSPSEKHAVLVHRLLRGSPGVTLAGFETDRTAFWGRPAPGRTPPAAVTGSPGRGRIGAVLDPVISLTAAVELGPGQRRTLAFVTAAARSRSAALDLVRRYGSMHAVTWVFRDASQDAAARLGRCGIAPDRVAAAQGLLSALLHANPALRAAAVEPSAACKSGLWGYGISGDAPILLVRVHEAREPELLAQVLAAHAFGREGRIEIDVVVLDCASSGYLADTTERLRRLLARHGGEGWIGRRGGIFPVANDRLEEEERQRLLASATAVLDSRAGGLDAQLARARATAARLPAFAATLPPRGGGSGMPPLLESLAFDNGTGGFGAGDDYVIRLRRGRATPAPWCNVLANPEFGCLVSESGLGCTWAVNSGENRLTPWQNDPVRDPPAAAVYLRDEETGEVWSATPLPAGSAQEWIVRHGAGHSSFRHTSHDLAQELHVTVPPDDPIEIVRLRVKNLLLHARRLTATFYCEWTLGSTPAETRPFVVTEHDAETGALLARCGWNDEFAARCAFVVAGNPIHGFTCDRTEFLGRNPDPASPAALGRWGLAGSSGGGFDPCAALQVHVELAPAGEADLHFVLGQGRDRATALALARRCRDPGFVAAAGAAAGAHWSSLLSKVRVKTPDPAMDLMLNRWLPYQVLASRLFGRTGFWQSSGAFGFRDQLQDVLALTFHAPDLVRRHILEAASHQFEQGDVVHWWHPPSGRGVRTRCSDDLLWLPYATARYVGATGDASILDENVSFLAGEELRADERERYARFDTGASASLLEHCRRALTRGLTEGGHGLPLIGDGDWNDGMNRVGSGGAGESVWLGWFACAAATAFAGLLERTGDGGRTEAEHWRRRVAVLRDRIEDCAWDGAWYLRAWHDDGSPLGSSTASSCRIDSIAQSWAVLSGAADPGRAKRALESVIDHLVLADDHLVLLLAPPFSGVLHDPGYIRAYPPGIRENGGQYAHAAAWVGHALAALGDGERAHWVFDALVPVRRATGPDGAARYRIEPYVVAGDVYTVGPWRGRGGWSWYTGAAAWTWRLGVEALLGLRLENGGLRVEPCLPPAWPGYEAWVAVHGHEIHVVVENPDGVGCGVVGATLDGAELEAAFVAVGDRLPRRSELRVRIGPPR